MSSRRKPGERRAEKITPLGNGKNVKLVEAEHLWPVRLVVPSVCFFCSLYRCAILFRSWMRARARAHTRFYRHSIGHGSAFSFFFSSAFRLFVIFSSCINSSRLAIEVVNVCWLDVFFFCLAMHVFVEVACSDCFLCALSSSSSLLSCYYSRGATWIAQARERPLGYAIMMAPRMIEPNE